MPISEISSNIPGSLEAGKTAAGKTIDPAHDKKLKKVCADFEAMMVFQMLKTMRKSVPRTGFLKPSQAQETYEMMLDQKISEELAGKAGGIGMQKILYKQMTLNNPKKD